jgi:hypothetical protein
MKLERKKGELLGDCSLTCSNISLGEYDVLHLLLTVLFFAPNTRDPWLFNYTQPEAQSKIGSLGEKDILSFRY